MPLDYIQDVLKGILNKKKILDAYYEKTLTILNLEDIYELFIKEAVIYMQSAPQYEAIYTFQAGAYAKLKDAKVEKEEEGCFLVAKGNFNPLEFSKFKDFLNCPTIEGSVEYDDYYGRDVYRPVSIYDKIYEQVKPLLIEPTNEFIQNIYIKKNIGVPRSIQKYILQNYGTQFLIYSLRTMAKDNWGIFSEKMIHIYQRGCELLDIKPQFTLQSYDYNQHFYQLIYDKIVAIYETPTKSCTTHNKKQKSYEYYIENMKKRYIPNSEKMILSELKNIRNAFSKFYNQEDHDKETFICFCDLIAQYEAAWYEISETTIELTAILEEDICVKHILQNGLKYVCTYTYVSNNTKKNIIDMIPPSPEIEYKKTRLMKRHFYIHYGPTNSGKTFCALNALKDAESGVYLGPLRLLALEVQEKLQNDNIPCSLLTGEEEDIVKNAKHIACTVEKANMEKEYDTCVIDECQMISDEWRGFAWTKAILGIQAKHIYLCTAPEAVNILIKMIKICGDEYELTEHTRRSELVISKPILFDEKYVRNGDAFIAFSKKSVLRAAAELMKKGKKVSVIYGNLPYHTRKQQVERFLNGTTDVVVSTDAIGMGLNLPVKRIVFLTNEKFDGKTITDIPDALIKQIAGRAGRDREKGYVTSILRDNSFIEKALKKDVPDIKKAYLGYSDDIISIDAELVDILNVWRSINPPALFQKMNMERFVELDRKSYLNVTKREKLKMMTIPFDERDSKVFEQWKKYCLAYEQKKDIEKPILNGVNLNDYELFYKQLDLYYSFARNFGYEIDFDWLNEEKIKISNEINNILLKDIITFRKRCNVCGKDMEWNSPYLICYKCHMS